MRGPGTRRGFGRRALAASALLVAAASCAGAAPGGSGPALGGPPSDTPAASVVPPPTTAPPAAVATAPTPPTPPAPDLLVGAHYYLWFPENLGGGVLGQHLLPRRGPDASYRSDDPAAAARAIAQASSAGVDFFTIDWWPTRAAQNARIDQGYLRAPNVADLRFAIFYETQDLGFDKYQGTTALTPARRARLVHDMVDIADRYFPRPEYLRVGGRPVVFWYLTRTLTGDVAGAVSEVRAALKARGYDVFVIGDEIFWRVATVGGARTTRPQVARARLFDAITAYNLYDADNRAYAGYPSTTRFAADAAALFATYRAAVGPAVPVIPSVIPGYNDRGTRPAENHYAIPRQWRPGDGGGSTLAHMLDTVAAPALDPVLPMALVTSWNEWNEDTAIEPMPTAAPTASDNSPSGRAFTQGYRYGGPGSPELDAVRAFVDQHGAADPPLTRGHA